MVDLHLDYQSTETLSDLLRAWDERIADEGPMALHRWTSLAVWPIARRATVAASTAIEGNLLTNDQVDEVLTGSAVSAHAADIRDVQNYNRTMDLANRVALRDDFEWTQELLRRLNATILDGLEDDERGEYRRQAVVVGGAYEPPDHRRVPALMASRVEWLQASDGQHTLIQAGLAHLNVVSIHPWLNGNGRASRVVGSLVLMRHGIAAPELVNIESVIRANPDAYVDALQTSHGPTYRPEDHSATPWLEYFAQIAVDRLELRSRLQGAIEADVGLLTLELGAAGLPLNWVPLLLAARLGPLRTSDVAARLNVSTARARAMVSGAATAGWLTPVGERRGRRYRPSDRLATLSLRTPDVMVRLRQGAPVED
jgi:Fic family protein